MDHVPRAWRAPPRLVDHACAVVYGALVERMGWTDLLLSSLAWLPTCSQQSSHLLSALLHARPSLLPLLLPPDGNAAASNPMRCPSGMPLILLEALQTCHQHVTEPAQQRDCLLSLCRNVSGSLTAATSDGSAGASTADRHAVTMLQECLCAWGASPGPDTSARPSASGLQPALARVHCQLEACMRGDMAALMGGGLSPERQQAFQERCHLKARLALLGVSTASQPSVATGVADAAEDEPRTGGVTAATDAAAAATAEPDLWKAATAVVPCASRHAALQAGSQRDGVGASSTDSERVVGLAVVRLMPGQAGTGIAPAQPPLHRRPTAAEAHSTAATRPGKACSDDAGNQPVPSQAGMGPLLLARREIDRLAGPAVHRPVQMAFSFLEMLQQAARDGFSCCGQLERRALLDGFVGAAGEVEDAAEQLTLMQVVLEVRASPDADPLTDSTTGRARQVHACGHITQTVATALYPTPGCVV